MTLFTKIDSKRQLSQSKKIIRSYFENLDVQEKILGINNAGWLQILVEGEDKKIAASYLIEEIGLCPINIDNIHKNSLLNGRISKFHENNLLSIDIGVFEPKIIPATISLERLREQLLPDNKASLKKISALFGLIKELPIKIKIIRINEEKKYIQAELSKIQLSLFKFWKKSLLDRLIIIGATRNQVKKALNLTRLTKDVINIESLGLFEQVLTCKLGTDAAGLIPVIGRILKTTKLTVFNPKKTHIFLKSKPQLISH
ncbi:MAG: DUF2110 family protein, partial [Candidatus Bathyarchaeota archaeon]|nr:DUF2110 family protein [Candidatus Bathyarchaeota archaeon]